MPAPIQRNVLNDDLSARFQSTATVQGSPIAAAAETIVATLTLADFNNIAVTAGIRLDGWAAFTVGTNGTAATLRIRQTNVAGTVVASSGAATVTAANLLEMSVKGLDATPGVGVYVLTLQITGGTANTTISADFLSGVVI